MTIYKGQSLQVVQSTEYHAMNTQLKMVENALRFYYCDVRFDSYHMALEDKHVCTSA